MSSAPISIRWAVQTMSGSLLGIFDTHSAAVERIEQCQSEAGTDSAWLADLRIRRTGVKA